MKNILNWKKMIGAAVAAVSLFTVGAMHDKVEAATVTVQHGQSLSLLAKQYGTTVNAIQYTNNLTSDLIVTGEKLNMPFVYKVGKNDTLWYVAKRYDTSVDDIMNVNNMKPGTMIKPGQNLMIPVGHVIGSRPKATTNAPAAAPKATAPATATSTASTPQAAPKATSNASTSTGATVAGHAYKSLTNMVATAYGPADETGPWGGLTYMGTKTRFGEIAVDPSVIPLGTKVFITGYNSPLLPAGGFVATAEDIGGKIKGNRIDIYINGSNAALEAFGMQNVKMYILK
ncbi:MAG: LysM peptidoglycan-binding domain-containing protein [Tumebacillaceae bacterium]